MNGSMIAWPLRPWFIPQVPKAKVSRHLENTVLPLPELSAAPCMLVCIFISMSVSPDF